MQGNYQTLMSYHNELNQYKRNSVLYGLLSSKINEFYKLNGVRIRSLTDKVQLINEKYFIFENGQPVFDGEGDERKQRMNEPYTMQEFEQEWNELMNTPCEIHFKELSNTFGNNGKIITVVR